MLLPRALFIARNCATIDTTFCLRLSLGLLPPLATAHLEPSMPLLTAGQIDNVMKEERLFPPPADFAAKARIGSMEEYEKLYRQAAADLEGFWGSLACELHWFEPFKKVLEWNEPFANWFVGGKTNASYNCLDVHLATHRRDKAALDLGGRAGRHARAHLPDVARRGLPLRQRAEATRHRPRRRGFDLHAAGAGTGHCHAGLRGSARSIA